MTIQHKVCGELDRLSEMLEGLYEQADAWEGQQRPEPMMCNGMINVLRKFFAQNTEAERLVATRFIVDRLLIDVWRLPPVK